MKHIWILACISLFANSAVAAENKSAAVEKAEKSAEKNYACDEDCRRYLDWQRNWSWSIGPRYMSQQTTGMNSAFISNGFLAPKQDLWGMDMRFGRHWDNGGIFGFDLLFMNTNRRMGTMEASYRFTTFGLRGGYDFLRPNGSENSLILAGTIGLLSTNTQVFSLVRDGERMGASLQLEPSISYFHKITKRFRLGLSASYLFAVGESGNTRGDDLQIAKMAPRGFSASLLLNFGHWDLR